MLYSQINVLSFVVDVSKPKDIGRDTLSSTDSYHSLSRYFCTHLEARNARELAFNASFSGGTL